MKLKEHMKHFVITRFNLPLGGGVTNDKNTKKTLTEEWLGKRFDLFGKYCFPSLKRQTNSSFVWIVLFAADTPALWKRKIECYKKECANFWPVFLTEEESRNLLPSLNRVLLSFGIEEGEKIVTTRIDNDDSWSVYAMDFLQKEVQTNNVENDYVLSFPRGAAYYPNKNYVVLQKRDDNHFLSLVEIFCKGKLLKTVYSFKHTQIPFLLRKITTASPMWLEVIHDTNVLNDVPWKGVRFHMTPFSLANYGMDKEIQTREILKGYIFDYVPRLCAYAFKRLREKTMKF